MRSFRETLIDFLLLYKFRVWTLLIYAGILSYLIAVSYGYPFNTVKLISLFFAGTLSIMGNGAINEYLEIEYDRMMKRTKNRPLVKGTISPKFAISSGIILLLGSVIISTFFINLLTTFFILLATFLYFVYTKLKRITWTNVLIGGFAGSCTAWGGWSAAANSLNIIGFLLGLLVYFWTNPHFWALALRLKDDYNSAGYKMLTAMLDEKNAAKIIAISTLPLPIVTLFIAFLGLLSIVFVYFSIALNILFIILATFVYLRPTKKNSWILFKLSTPWLAVIFLLIFLDINKYFLLTLLL